MIRRVLLLAVLWLALLPPAHAADPGWRVDRAATLEKVKRIGMLPATSELGEQRRDALPSVEQLVRQQLESAGLTVIGPEAYTEIRQRLLKQLGGIYDARTGQLNTAKQRALDAQALRSFLEEQRLDATLITEIRVRTASIGGFTAYWDQVSDRADGPSRGFLKTLLDPTPAITGSTSALSLVLILSGTNDATLFAAAGGIELMAYSAPAQFGGFRYVPEESLLRDEPRLRRAVEAASLYLRKSQAQIDAEAKAQKDARDAYINAVRSGRNPEPPPKAPKPEPLPEQPAAPDPDEIQPFKKPREEVLASIKRVVIAPLSVDEADDNAGVRRRYEQLLTEQLQKLGWDAVSSTRYMELLAAERDQQSGAIFDVDTGKRLGDTVELLRQRALEKLIAEGQPVDAIVYSSIVRASAPYENEDAKWDGVQQNAVDLGPWKKRGFFEGFALPGSGRMPALSLGVAIVARNGEALYGNRGGIQVLKQVIERKLEPIPKAQVLTGSARDAEAVRVALRPLLLTPEQLDVELNPGKPKKKPRTGAPKAD